MSQWHGQIAKIAMSLQYAQSYGGFPNWEGAVHQMRTNVENGWGSDLGSAIWLSDLPVGAKVRSRELMDIATRYPGRNNQTWRYAAQLNVNGASNRVGLRVLLSGTARASDKGLDQGARSGTVYVESCTVVFMDGTTANPIDGLALFTNINGWAGQTTLWNWTYDLNYGKPIQRVTLSLKAYYGQESYHDVGDRSQGWSYNPTAVVGFNPFGVGYQYGEPNINTVTSIDRECDYIVINNTGTAVVGTRLNEVTGGGTLLRIA